MTVSGAMYAEVVERAAGKYNPLLKPLQLKDVLDILSYYPTISLVKKKTLEVGVIIAKVDGSRISFWMTFDLHGPNVDIESFLHSVVKQCALDQVVEVQNGALCGEIFLPEEPYRIPTRHNGAMYFLNSEKETVLAFLAQDLAASR